MTLQRSPGAPLRTSRPIQPDEILDLGDYERARDRLRRAAMDARALRRVAIGPDATLSFENRTTVLYQLQEMLHAERLARPEEIAHELETYNELLPGPTELSATLFFEFPDPALRARRLVELVGIERHVRLDIGERSGAVPRAESSLARFDS